MNRSSLTRYAPLMRDPDPDGAHKLAARQWHENGSIVLLPESIAELSWEDRALVQAIAARLYGQRG